MIDPTLLRSLPHRADCPRTRAERYSARRPDAPQRVPRVVLYPGGRERVVGTDYRRGPGVAVEVTRCLDCGAETVS